VIKKLLFVILLFGIAGGILGSYLFFTRPETILPQGKKVIGFLPYWLLSRAKADYSPYVTQLSYFGVTVHEDGTVLRLQNAQETEPGWLALKTGKVDTFLESAKNKNISLSLTAFNGDVDSINRLMEHPKVHARNLVRDIAPVMRQYGFTDLNLDIESVADASSEGQLRFVQFVRELKENMDREKLGTLTVDITASSLIRKNLINPFLIAPYVDYIIIMAYDFHYSGSYVTGPVAPLKGTETVAELDSNVVVKEALSKIPSHKIILGIPLYGYKWETLNSEPRAAIIPGTGLAISSQNVEQFLADCASCSAQIDQAAEEKYIVYKDEETGTFYQIFYPDKNSTSQKIKYVEANSLGGVALWALGYEDSSILDPLKNFK
jgi:spore germination protein YaaH